MQAPQPADAWEGIRDALTEGPVAPQVDTIVGSGYDGEEDCLSLNVYTPKVNSICYKNLFHKEENMSGQDFQKYFTSVPRIQYFETIEISPEYHCYSRDVLKMNEINYLKICHH